jgi:hypothetical protein
VGGMFVQESEVYGNSLYFPFNFDIIRNFSKKK